MSEAGGVMKKPFKRLNHPFAALTRGRLEKAGEKPEAKDPEPPAHFVR
jgi:hypothetical protein